LDRNPDHQAASRTVIDAGKKNLLGVLVDAVDYEAAVARIAAAAAARRAYGVSALAVHGVMTGALDPEQRYRINALDLVTPDGQPVRWGLNRLHRAALPDRVYGPKLMLAASKLAAERGYPVYLYGSRQEVLERLVERLRLFAPGIELVGAEQSKYRPVSSDEKQGIVERIVSSGARLTFVGLGCPRQEVFAYEYRNELSMPVVGVGAAFDYLAGVVKEPSEAIQRLGLQWARRLAQDPKRLWRRYLVLNPAYVALLLFQLSGGWRPEPSGDPPTHELRYA
jgi:N-acetylglucosaminyldiphosphoundecaprenol N-acetyl-beta-D-mannosaminyltransferase